MKTPSKIVCLLINRLHQLEKYHFSRVRTDWFGPEPKSKLFLTFIAILVVFAISGNVYVRNTQFQIWQSAAPSTFIFGSPSFSTADAPYFLGHAGTYKRDEAVSRFDSKRSYPNNMKANSNTTSGSNVRDHPLLSILIANLAESDEPSSLLKTGNLVLLVTSNNSFVSLFATEHTGTGARCDCWSWRRPKRCLFGAVIHW